MKYPPDTVFAKWLKDNRYSDQAFADAINDVDPAVKCTASTVRNWRRRKSGPRARAYVAIQRISKEEITVDSFEKLA